MRLPILLRSFVFLLVLGVATHASADDRSDARAHYQTAAKLYANSDYRGAIREFSQAQQLFPADLNNYNLALCYDKLGDAEPALQYYRAFLDKQPNSDKRAEVDASIARLDAAVKSAASKKDAAAAAVAKDNGPVLGPAAPSADVGAAVGAGAAVGTVGPAVGPAPAPSADADQPPVAPHKKKHGPAVAAGATGDSQLDRVNGLNIDDIRDQRFGAQAGTPGPGTGAPAGDPNAPQAQPGQPAGPNQPVNGALATAPVNGDEPKKDSPVYKKWWFWVVVAVGGYVVYELATSSSSSSSNNVGREMPAARAPSAGMTLLRW